jgi:hypothetical protein
MDGSTPDDPCSVGYKADLEARTIQGIGGGLSGPLDTYAWNWEHKSIKWRPSIHMPRWASRINLEVTNIRVEMVQDIPDGDISEEGIRCPIGYLDYPELTDMAENSFRDLWNSINKKRGFGWDENPWVWVVEFRRV